MNTLKELFNFGRENYRHRLQQTFPDVSLIMNKKIPVVIYGAARMGMKFRTNLAKNGINIAAFADSNSALWGKNIDGVTVISPEELRRRYPDNPILVASLLYETEIYEMLSGMGFLFVYPLCYLNYTHPDIFVSPEYYQKFDSLFIAENQSEIFTVNGYWEDEESRMVFYNIIKFRLTFDKSLLKSIRSKQEQYFEPDIMPFGCEEVFLDCGAYVGDTVEQFHKVVSGKFNKVYSFEPDPSNFLKLCDRIKCIDSSRIFPVNMGVYRKSGKEGFSVSGHLDTKIGEGEDAVSLPVVSIDDFLKNKEDATFIKMDIEGVETDALLGAKNTIQKNKPKLAIAVYHNACDLWKTPLLIKNLKKDYRFYLRHYTNEIIDTVCYAV